MITYLINSNLLAICTMKSNIVIVRRAYLEMSLHSSDLDRDAELAILRNPPDRHCDVFQRSDAQSV